MTKIPVSVVIPVKNEEALLGACLARLGRFDEILVVDSASTDRTAEIAAESGARVINFNWNGQYPKKRNWVLMTQRLANDWVLFLDADEFVDDAFCNAVAEAIKSDAFNGYWLNYTNHFLGRVLNFGVPQRKLALFRVDAGLYERIDEDSWSALDMEVHEHPVLTGAIGTLHQRIDHRDDRGLVRFIDRHRDYAMWEANRANAIFENLDIHAPNLTKRQHFKYRHLKSWWFPYAYFLGQYLLRLGILDGHAGLQYAQYKFWYFSTVRLLMRDTTSPRTTATSAPNTVTNRAI